MKQTTRDANQASTPTTALSSHVSSGPAREYERSAYPERTIPGEERV